MRRDSEAPRRRVPPRALLYAGLPLLTAAALSYYAPELAGRWQSLLLLLVLLPAFAVACRRAWLDTATLVSFAIAGLVALYVLGVALRNGVAPWWIVGMLAAALAVLVVGVTRLRWWLRQRRHQLAPPPAPAEPVVEERIDPLRDPLTGLVDRRHVELLLETQIAAARRGRVGPVAVVFGLDSFGQYLERHGRPDALVALAQAADTLKKVTRRMDVTTRIGDDRFLTVLNGSSEEGAVAFARRVKEQLARSDDASREPVTVSAGIALYDDVMEEPRQLLAAAERALEVARGLGFERLEVHSPRRTMT